MCGVYETFKIMKVAEETYNGSENYKTKPGPQSRHEKRIKMHQKLQTYQKRGVLIMSLLAVFNNTFTN